MVFSFDKDSDTDFGSHSSEYWSQEHHNSELRMMASSIRKTAEMLHNFACWQPLPRLQMLSKTFSADTKVQQPSTLQIIDYFPFRAHSSREFRFSAPSCNVEGYGATCPLDQAKTRIQDWQHIFY